MSLLSPFERRLKELDEASLLRTLSPSEAVGPGRVEREGRSLWNFSSNDYLGLSLHPRLRERAEQWMREWGVGAAASRLVTGSSRAISELEAKIARFKGTERALVFCSGFQANASVLAALLDPSVVGREVQIFSDKLVHASLHFGCAAAGARQTRFRHNDIEHLRTLLRASKPGAFRIILVESVYSMDGDRADLAGLREIADEFDAFLFVDEAHATGILGPGGAGLAAEAGVRTDCTVGTFSKAMGVAGAYVACSDVLARYLVNRCSGFIYSTGLSPAVLGAIDAALDLVPQMDEERRRVARNAENLREWARARALSTLGSSTQIVPIVVGEARRAVALSRSLEEMGCLVAAIRPPTVPEGSARLRISLSERHGTEALQELRSALDMAVSRS